MGVFSKTRLSFSRLCRLDEFCFCMLVCLLLFVPQSCVTQQIGRRVETESGGTRRRTGGEVKWKEANGVGSQQSSAWLGTVYPVLLQSFSPDPHYKKASTRLIWHPRRYKWTCPFRWKTESGFCACAITARFHSTIGWIEITVDHQWSAVFSWQYAKGSITLIYGQYDVLVGSRGGSSALAVVLKNDRIIGWCAPDVKTGGRNKSIKVSTALCVLCVLSVSWG